MGNRCCLVAGDLGATADEAANNDPSLAAANATVLNRWRCVEVATLQAKFRSHANSKRLLDQHGFEELFPFLKELPSAARQSVFRAFHQPHKHAIDFHDFCWTLSLCVHGTEEEMEHLLFALFTGSCSTSVRPGSVDSVQETAAGALEMRAVTQLQHHPSTDSAAHAPMEDGNGHVLHLEESAVEYKNADVDGEQQANGTAPAGFEEGKKLTLSALQAMLRFCNVPRSEVESVAADCPSSDLDFPQFVQVAAKYLPGEMITAALKQFDLLPSAAQERDLVRHALAELANTCSSDAGGGVVEEGDTVYLLLSSWWRQWCNYVKVIPQYDLTATYVVSLNCMDGNTTPTHRSRPNEIDNSELQSPVDPVNLRLGLRPGDECDFVAVPLTVWQQLLELYGGGPVLARRVAHVVADDEEEEGVERDMSLFSVVVDPYPVMLKGFWCNRFGKPEPMATDLIVSGRSTILTLLNRGIREHQLQHALKPEDVRVWILKFNLPEDTGTEKPEAPTPTAQDPPPEEEVPQKEGSSNASANGSHSPRPHMLRSGLTSWWVLLEDDERRLTLEDLELGSGARIMLEVQNSEHEWPADRMIEPRSFRNFKVEDRVDAMDYQGRWYAGSVTHVQQTTGIRSSMGMINSPGVYNFPASTDFQSRYPNAAPTTPGAATSTTTYTKVRVHFDKFSAKWDEWYDINSHKLAPLGCYTADQAALPIIPILDKPTQEPATGETTSVPSDPTRNPSPTPGKSVPEVTPSPATTGARGNEVSRKPTSKSFSLNPARFLRPASSSAPQENGASRGGFYNGFGFGAITRRGNDLRTPSPERPGLYPAPRRRGYNSSRPSVLGACGLVNLGNTCFLNTALQCLSHTPLFRAYLLSNRFLLDVNRQNPLGTQGRIVEEYASLLRQLWSGESMYVVPSKFKRVLEKYKPQFAGHDQQDAQEFLAEMLDCLHEDVNRVLTKPYVPGLEDEEIERLTLRQHADDSWQRHLARNRSVLVDLFQGQLQNEVKCPQCNKVSRTFDPFMFLSVPIPRQHEVVISVVFHPRLRTRSSVDPFVVSWAEALLREVVPEDEFDQLPSLAREMLSDAPRPIKLALKLPKLSDVGQLKIQVGKMVNLRPDYLSVAEVYRHRFHRFLDDRQPVAYFSEHDMVHVFESTKNVRRIFTWTTKRLQHHDAGLASQPSAEGTAAGDGVSEPDFGLKAPKEETDGYYSEDDDDVLVSKMHTGEGGIVVDIDNTEEMLGVPRSASAAQTKKANSSLKSIEDFRVGMRVDASDHRNQWFTGSVIEIKPATEDKRAELCVHFDNFSSKWDETYSDQDVKARRVLPANTRTVRKPKILDFQIIHRRVYVSALTQQAATRAPDSTAAATTNASTGTAAATTSPTTTTPKNPMEVFGDPMIVVCESYRSTEHAYRQIVLQALRNVDPEYRRAYNLIVSDLDTANQEAFWQDQERLPFTVRLASTQNPYVSQCEEGALNESGIGKRWEGCPFPRSALRPAGNIQHRQLLVTVDWHNPGAYWKDRDTPLLHKSYTRWQEQQARDGSAKSGVTLQDCLKAFTSEEELEDASWYCSKCKQHQQGLMRCALWRLPDMLVIHLKRFNCSARFREKIRTKVVFPLTSLDLSEYVSNMGGSQQRNDRAGDNPADFVYDLYAVSNHLGGMAGGHYTAFVNCVPCGQDGVEEVAISSRDQSDGKWLHFDDEFVEEIPADRVVSEAAYVLFYRKRRLTPSNIINMTV